MLFAPGPEISAAGGQASHEYGEHNRDRIDRVSEDQPQGFRPSHLVNETRRPRDKEAGQDGKRFLGRSSSHWRRCARWLTGAYQETTLRNESASTEISPLPLREALPPIK